MKTMFYIKNDTITERKCVVESDFNKDDDVYYDSSDKNIHVSLIDASYVWQTVKVQLKGGSTVFFWLDNWDDLTDVLPAEEIKTFTMRELDRIELSYGKNISVINTWVPSYETNDISNRLTTVDTTRYNELIAAA